MLPKSKDIKTQSCYGSKAPQMWHTTPKLVRIICRFHEDKWRLGAKRWTTDKRSDRITSHWAIRPKTDQCDVTHFLQWEFSRLTKWRFHPFTPWNVKWFTSMPKIRRPCPFWNWRIQNRQQYSHQLRLFQDGYLEHAKFCISKIWQGLKLPLVVRKFLFILLMGKFFCVNIHVHWGAIS